MNRIGIRAEGKNWESRVTVTPEDIVKQSDNIMLVYENEPQRSLPLKHRVFSNEEILESGKKGGARTETCDNLNDCQVVIGTKEVKGCYLQLTAQELQGVKSLSFDFRALPFVVFMPKRGQIHLTDFLTEEEKVEIRSAMDGTAIAPLFNRLLELQEKLIGRGKVYVLFSHTHKGQAYNMRMLRKMIDNECTLFDYELLREAENGISKRTVAYSRWAGVIGALEALRTWGAHYQARTGAETWFPLLHSEACYSKTTFEYSGIRQIRMVIDKIVDRIQTEGLPQPLSVAISGWRGEVGQGALEMLMEWGLPVQEISATDFRNQKLSSLDRKSIYLVRLNYADLYRHRDGVSLTSDEIKDLLKKGLGKRLESNMDQYFDKLSVFLNCIVWNQNSPRLLTNSFLRFVYNKNKGKGVLPVIGDISCDPNGSIQCCRDTYPNAPSYIWEPETSEEPISAEHDLKQDPVDSPHFDLGRYGFALTTVTNLPCQIPRDASNSFSRAFCQPRASLNGKSYLQWLAETDFSQKALPAELPQELRDGIILYQGRFNATNPQLFLKDICVSMLQTGMLDPRKALPIIEGSSR